MSRGCELVNDQEEVSVPLGQGILLVNDICR